MKKLLFFLALIFIFIFTASLSFAAPIGKITQLQGRVDVLKTGKNMVAPVSLGAPVDIGDIYRAKTNSRAEITFINKNILRIAPATRVEIKEYMAEGNRSSSVMRLHRGRVQAISGEEFVKRVAAFAEGNKFEVHTPNAVAGIRGSDMLVGFNQGTTVVIFIAGHGYLYNPEMPQLITPIATGQMSFVTGEGTPSQAVKASEAFISGGGEAFIQIIETKELPGEAPPPPPPPVYVPPPIFPEGTTIFEGAMTTQLSGGSGGTMDLTLIGGIPSNQSSGTMSASGTYTMYGSPKIISGDVEGTSSTGGLFYGLTGGVIGSWGATSYALYAEGGSVGLLRSSLLGTLGPIDPDTEIGTVSGSGILALQKSLGTITLDPPGLEETPLDVFKNFVNSSTPYPASSIGPWAFGTTDDGVTLGISGDPVIDYKGITTNEGKKITIIREKALGTYKNTGPYSLAGGMIGFYQDASPNAYLLGPAIFTDNGANKMSMVVSYDYIDKYYMGYRDMQYYGTYDDGSRNVGVDYRWMGTGAQVLTPTDFGGEWYNSTLYNDDGYLGWNSEGNDYGYFGFLKRADGNYKFLAIGEFYDYDYGTEDFGRPYIWSGSLWGNETTPYRYLEGFTGGLRKKANLDDTYGTMTGYAAAVYYTEDGKVGLIRGALTGNFYEMYYDSYVSGMWKVESGASGLTTIAKTVPAGFVSTRVWISSNSSLEAYTAGSFGTSTENTIFGEYYKGQTKFITYNDASYEDRSLPFGIYNLKLGEGSDYNYYEGKPASASVSWSAKIGGNGDFGYNSSDEGYWLAGITGTWNEYSSGAEHGTINGALSGKYITSTHMGTIGGPFYGLYTEDGICPVTGGYGTWVGLSVGTYESTTPLTTSITFSTSDATPTTLWRALPGTYYEGHFTQKDTSSNNYLDYRFEYIKTSGMGIGKTEDDHDFINKKDYFPNGTMLKRDQDGRVWMASWDIGSIELVRNLPAWMDPDNDFFTPTAYSEWPSFLDVLEKRTSDYLDAILGMTGYPWSTGGTPVTIIGKYTADGSDYTKPMIVTTPFLFGTFYTPYVEGGTPYGAYGVTLGGFIADDTRGVQMAIRGLYIGPDNATAGVLRTSQAMTGSFYKDIGMWDAEGTLIATVMNSNFATNNPGGVTINTLDASGNIVSGPIGSEIMGRFTGDSGSLFASMMNEGTTRNIKGQDWGIMSSTIWAGGFGVTSTTLPGTWSTQVGGMGQFGEYKDASDNWQADIGMMLIPTLNGTLTGGVVKASYTSTVGEFMTMTKMGTISDVGVLGVYTQPSPVTTNKLYSWQGVMGGVWNTTQYFTFASSFDTSNKRFAEQHSGYYFNGSYNEYYFNYDNEVKYGEINFFSNAGRTLITQREYCPDCGPFSTYLWEEFTYKKGTNTFSGYSTGTDYPASFSDAFFSDLAVSRGSSAPNNTSTWWNFTHDGSISAIMGGVGDLWTATASSPATVYFLGDYDHWYGKPTIFGTDIVSYNVKNDTNTTLDNKGAYVGYIGGREIDSAIEGRIYAIYIDPDDDTYPAGILKGTFTGTVYPEIEMWAGQGSIYPVKLMDVAVPLGSFFDHIYTRDFYDEGSSTSFTLKVGGTEYNMGEAYSRPFVYQGEGITFYATEGSWGVWQSAIGGKYTGITPTDSWTASITYIDSTRIMGTETTGTKWSGNKIEGTTVGYGADIVPEQTYTWISVGEVKGTFNTTLYTLQAGIMGVSIETNTYLTLASTSAGRTKLQQLGIPAVQVGMDTLTGSGNNFTTLSMNDVKFFATSAGGKPSIWATNSVTGNYTAPPSTSTAISLSGSTLNASFNFKQWNTTGDNAGKWLGSVSGTGGFNGSTTFKGAAAGLGATAVSGSIAGTAAGIAK
jgi:hypothetical protein